MSDLQDVIVSSSIRSFNVGLQHGIKQERNRILEVLNPHAEHNDWCKDGGCYPEDCSAGIVQYLINKILETDLQKNVNNTGQEAL